MEIWEAVKSSFRQYSTFTGTTPRAEYWYFLLALLIGSAIFSVLGDEAQTVFSLATVIPWAAASARRLRDAGESMQNFWWLLLPLVGLIILLVKLAKPQQSSL
jgi:uncharacterized membrane protein YhaH (DUF805 family)